MSVAFPLVSDLHPGDQAEVARITAIPAASRKASETAFLNARSLLTANRIIDKDPDGNILRCQSNVAPTTTGAGFAKGCQWINTAAAAGNNGLYLNTGTTLVAAWQQATSA